MFILDANALIHACKHDFPLDGDHDGFWDCLDSIALESGVSIPQKIIKEVSERKDVVGITIAKLSNIKILPTKETTPNLSKVLNAYSDDLDEVDLEELELGADPYLVAHAMSFKGSTVVTDEVPHPNATLPKNKKIPDICKALGIECQRYPRFLWEMRKIIDSK